MIQSDCSGRAPHAWMEIRCETFPSRCVLLCSVLWLSGVTPTLAGQPYVGNQSPHVGPLYTRRMNGHVHAWKAGFAGRDWDHGCGCRSDVGHGHLHHREDPGKRSALLPAPGRKPAVFAHDQHHGRKTVFQTSHAGTRVSSPGSTRSGAAWVRLNFIH